MDKVLRAARSRRAVSAVESPAARPITTASSGPPQRETEHCQAQRKILDFFKLLRARWPATHQTPSLAATSSVSFAFSSSSTKMKINPFANRLVHEFAIIFKEE